jgi:hypothetical protein
MTHSVKWLGGGCLVLRLEVSRYNVLEMCSILASVVIATSLFTDRNCCISVVAAFI